MTKVESYGIVQQDQPNSDLELNIEKFHRKGYVKYLLNINRRIEEDN